jgi:hypothetical protein
MPVRRGIQIEKRLVEEVRSAAFDLHVRKQKEGRSSTEHLFLGARTPPRVLCKTHLDASST